MGLRMCRTPLAAVAVPFLLIGCAAPGAVGVASYGFDGFSYATTGKSLSDNTLSQVNDQNCSIWRVFVARSICRDYTQDERREIEAQQAKIERRETAGTTNEPNYTRVSDPPSPEHRMLVAATPDHMTTTSAGALRPGAETTIAREPIDPGFDRRVDPSPDAAGSMDASELRANASGSGARPAAKRQAAPPVSTGSPIVAAAPAAASNPAATTAPRAGTGAKYLVLGSFANRGNAEDALARYPDGPSNVATTVVDGRVLHRVVSGPYASDALSEARARLAAAYGIGTIWVLPACTGASASGCVTVAGRGGSTAQLAARP